MYMWLLFYMFMSNNIDFRLVEGLGLSEMLYDLVFESAGGMGEERRRRVRVRFSAVSIPEPILEEIDRLIEELGYWPSRSAFVREACL
ncbi:MAG: ribbon-helix-helix domain-containing protein, partial [Candidatus Bathyarchaeia archaeon]